MSRIPAAAKADMCNCAVIRSAARHVTQLYDRHLAPSGLTVTQFAILVRLDRHGPLTVNRLAAQMGMDRTTLGRIVKPLQRDALVAVAADPQDGRRRALSATDLGLRQLAAARPLWRDAQASFESAVGAEPSHEFRTLLARILTTRFDEPGPLGPS